MPHDDETRHDAEDADPMDSKELMERLAGITGELERQREERHAVNGRIHKALAGVYESTSLAERRSITVEKSMEKLSGDMAEIKGATARIERCLNGEACSLSSGLVADHADLVRRFSSLAKEQEKLEGKFAQITTGWRLIVVAGGVFGGLVTFAHTVYVWIKGP